MSRRLERVAGCDSSYSGMGSRRVGDFDVMGCDQRRSEASLKSVEGSGGLFRVATLKSDKVRPACVSCLVYFHSRPRHLGSGA